MTQIVQKVHLGYRLAAMRQCSDTINEESERLQFVTIGEAAPKEFLYV